MTKAVVGVADRPWLKARPTYAAWVNPKNQMWLVDSSAQSSRTDLGKGILSMFAAQSFSQDLSPEIRLDMKEVTADLPIEESTFQVQNWQLYPWSKGSHFYFKPGDYLQRTSPHSEDLSWVFAGDSFSTRFPGTMNGAVESGEEAAHMITQRFRSVMKI